MSFLTKLRDTIKSCHGWKTEDMIKKLNPMIRGWATYHRNVQASKVFSFADTIVFQSLSRWIKRRHPWKCWWWIIKKYFNNLKLNKLHHKWVFSCGIKDRSGTKQLLEVIKPSSIKLVRYIKIKGKSNPFDPQYTDYFKMRRSFKNYYPINSNSLAAEFS